MEPSDIVIAAIQSRSWKGEWERNVKHHVELVHNASLEGADVAVFPELSLTGYEPELASTMALAPDSFLVAALRRSADEHGIVIMAGAPIRSEDAKPFIGTLIVRPNNRCQVYRKRFLHPGEDRHFIPGQEVTVVSALDCRIGVAICADINHARHSGDVAGKGADVYVAGVAITPGGIDEANRRMSDHASRHQFLTMMANHASPTGGFAMSGGSGAWDENGKILARGPDSGECMVIAARGPQGWTARVVNVDVGAA